MKPNIFDYATSELSQDAFLAWLFKWAEKDNAQDDAQLHNCAKECLYMFLGGMNLPDVETLDIYKQREKIDLLITVNENVHLIIEDKVGTAEHDNQLKRYKEIVQGDQEDTDASFSFVYYKTGDITVNERKTAEKENYKVISGEDLLSVFEKYEIKNAIFNDYKEKLKSMQNIEILNHPFEEILKKGVADKAKCANAFHNCLSPELDCSEGGYVNNPSKPFYGLWWWWMEYTGTFKGTVYFQFEDFDLKIRLCDIEGAENKTAARTEIHNILMEVAGLSEKYNGMITRPQRFGNGNTMTIATVDQKAWLSLDENGRLDIDGILENLHSLEEFLAWAVEEYPGYSE